MTSSTEADNGPFSPAIDPLDHTGLVGAIANRYRNRGLDKDDLFQEGMIGLIEACRTFKEGMGSQFSSYAGLLIRRTIADAVAGNPRPVRIPPQVYGTVIKVRTGEVKMEDLPPKFRACVESAMFVLSLGVGHEEMEIVDTRNGNDPADGPRVRVSPPPVVAEVAAYLEILTPVDREVLSLRHGLGDEPSLAFEEIGTRLGLNRKNVAKRYRDSLERIRKHSRGERQRKARGIYSGSRAAHGSRSPFKGVHRTPEGTYSAKLCGDGVVRSLGTFASAEEAREIVNEAAYRLFKVEGYAKPRAECQGKKRRARS